MSICVECGVNPVYVPGRDECADCLGESTSVEMEQCRICGAVIFRHQLHEFAQTAGKIDTWLDENGDSGVNLGTPRGHEHEPRSTS